MSTHISLQITNSLVMNMGILFDFDHIVRILYTQMFPASHGGGSCLTTYFKYVLKVSFNSINRFILSLILIKYFLLSYPQMTGPGMS